MKYKCTSIVTISEGNAPFIVAKLSNGDVKLEISLHNVGNKSLPTDIKKLKVGNEYEIKIK